MEHTRILYMWCSDQPTLHTLLHRDDLFVYVKITHGRCRYFYLEQKQEDC